MNIMYMNNKYIIVNRPLAVKSIHKIYPYNAHRFQRQWLTFVAHIAIWRGMRYTSYCVLQEFRKEAGKMKNKAKRMAASACKGGSARNFGFASLLGCPSAEWGAPV